MARYDAQYSDNRAPESTISGSAPTATITRHLSLCSLYASAQSRCCQRDCLSQGCRFQLSHGTHFTHLMLWEWLWERAAPSPQPACTSSEAAGSAVSTLLSIPGTQRAKRSLFLLLWTHWAGWLSPYTLEEPQDFFKPESCQQPLRQASHRK